MSAESLGDQPRKPISARSTFVWGIGSLLFWGGMAVMRTGSRRLWAASILAGREERGGSRSSVRARGCQAGARGFRRCGMEPGKKAAVAAAVPRRLKLWTIGDGGIWGRKSDARDVASGCEGHQGVLGSGMLSILGRGAGSGSAAPGRRRRRRRGSQGQRSRCAGVHRRRARPPS